MSLDNYFLQTSKINEKMEVMSYFKWNKDGLDFGRLWRIKKENIGKDARS